MLIDILKMVLPVMLMLVLGKLCASKGVLTGEAQASIKDLVCNVLLPISLFNAFFTAHYDRTLVIMLLVNFSLAGVAMTLGYLLRRCVRPYERYFPMLLTCMEGGMIGYALYGVIAGGNLTGYAMADIGQSLFIFTVYLSMVARENGEKLGGMALVKNALSNRCFQFILAGILLGALGVRGVAGLEGVWGLYDEIVGFVTAPISGMILLVIGAQLSFSREMMKPVMTTVCLRAVINIVLCAIGCAVIFAFVPFDKQVFSAMAVQYIVPTCFVISVYAKGEADARYVATTLSVGTIAAALLFIPVTMMVAMI